MSRFSNEPPELEPCAEDFLEPVRCARCEDVEQAREGEIPQGWSIRDRQPMCPDCTAAEDRAELAYDCADSRYDDAA